MNIMKLVYLKTKSTFKYLLLILFIFVILNKQAKTLENKILIKVNNEIITTLDISNEIAYLAILNKELLKLEKNQIIEIAKNNLIRNKIKKKELLKYTNEIKIDKNYLKKLVEDTYKPIGFKETNEFILFLEKNGINLKYIENKITINENWRQFVYLKYKNQIKINKEQVIQDVTNEKNKYFQLSEILFDLNNSNLEKKFNLISENIKLNGFKNTALLFSVSDSSDQGGELGWISGKSISKNILNELNNIKVGDFTNPIRTPGGFLILKINDIKEEIKKEDNINNEVDKIINLKINNQLKQFSNLYLKKLEKDSIINEL